LLLKDTLVIPFVLAGILLILKMVNPIRSQSPQTTADLFVSQTSNGIKDFSWLKLFLFFIILTCLINLRFYVGYALMFTFIFSWPLLSVFDIKKRMIYWLAIIFLLGFSPQMLGNGYYGFNSFKNLLNPERITYYREVVYSSNPPLDSQPTTPQPTTPQPSVPQQKPSEQELNGNGSTFVLETGFNGGASSFLKNSFQSFLYSLLGPFPWQFRHQRQIVGLVETIPWYLLVIISIYGSIRFIMKKGFLEFLKYHRFCLPLLLFGLFTLGALSLFINNYGIIARIRIPVFICFISIMFISLNSDIEDYSKKLYAKISYYWGRWVHRLPFIKNAFAKWR
jgi:hypothetical protein